MLVIHKYLVKEYENGITKILMPEHAEVLSAIVQNGKIVIYAIVNPIHEPVYHDFFIAYTGVYLPSKDLSDRFKFITSLQIGPVVFHLFKLEDEV